MKKHIIAILLAFVIVSIYAQKEELKGMIMIKENNKTIGIEGINIYWKNTKIGTTTNEEGWFTIPYKKEYKKLIISYLGFKTDTLTIISNKKIHHTLKADFTLNEVAINARKQTTSLDNAKIASVINIDSGELFSNMFFD